VTDLTQPERQLLKDVVLARNGHKSALAAVTSTSTPGTSARFNLKTERQRLDAALFEAKDVIAKLAAAEGIE